MANTVYVQVRNLTTGTISGSVMIDTKTPVKFGPLQPNGGVSPSFTEANLTGFQCAVAVQGAPHNGTARATLQIPDGADSARSVITVKDDKTSCVNAARTWRSSECAPLPILLGFYFDPRMSVKHLVEEFSTLEDPRRSGKIEHRLIDILVIAVCAVIAGAESWEDIALYGRGKIGWLSTFLALPHAPWHPGP